MDTRKSFNSDVVIGLEIHIELNTKTKLFCSCPRTGSEEPNTRTCPVCLGHPGSKPVLNKKALEYALKFALAVSSNISKELVFSRKSYFYPDMSKNFQISQYELPLATNGFIVLDDNSKIELTRVHIEEDPASLVHPKGIENSPFVLIDYNRSGNPLVEIVTEPVIKSPAQARQFMKQLLLILDYLEIFDINSCVLKSDANVSIRESNYTRVEIKNISSFKDIESALEYEIKRQKSLIQSGKKVITETRGWNSDAKRTFPMRSKETEEDYGYIIDPDLVVIDITDDMVADAKEQLPELPYEKKRRLMRQYGLKEEYASILSSTKYLADFFEYVVRNKISPVIASKWIIRDLVGFLNNYEKDLSYAEQIKLSFIDLLSLLEKRHITDKTAQQLLEMLVQKDFNVIEHVEKNNLRIVADEEKIEEFCRQAIDENPVAVEDYLSGKEQALNFLIGKVMAKTKGTASPKELKDIFMRLLSVR